MPLPISLIIDDGSPMNLMYWLRPDERHVHLFPNSFIRDFADTCDRHGATGKFTILPMPAALGRIDRGLNHVHKAHLDGYLDVLRKRILPRWDITIEFLTHDVALDVKTGKYLREFEDHWASRATAEEMTEYFALALRILKNVGLPANGVTSPWVAGIDNELRYAQAVACAQWRVHRRRFSWYFLHCLGRRQPRWPWVAWRSAKAGLTCVTVPANTDDMFWHTATAPSARHARRAALAGVDQMLSKDGRHGRVREIFDARVPILLLTHWQSLFSEGRCAGLWGLDKLLARIEKVFGQNLEWMTCSRLARMAVARGPAINRSGLLAGGHEGPTGER